MKQNFKSFLNINLRVTMLLMLIAVPILIFFGSTGYVWAKTDDTSSDMVTLNFRDSDIMAVLEVFSEMFEKAFIPDEAISGTVTVITPHPVPKEVAKRIFYSVLDMRQFALVEYDNYFKVTSKQKASRGGLSLALESDNSDKMQTAIIHLAHAKAESIVADLSRLISEESNIFAAKELNYLVITATQANIRKIAQIVKEIDQPGLQREQKSYKLQYLSAENVAKTLMSLFENSAPDDYITAIPSVDTNAILITATSGQHNSIEKLIKEMDYLRRQVSISSMFVEVTLTEETKMGVEWLLKTDPKGITSELAHDLGQILQTGSSGVSKISGKGLKLSVLKAGEFELLASFFSSADDANVVSTPHILTMENQEAKLQVGNQIPVKKGTRYDSENREISTYEQLDVGLELTVTPVISENQDITLKIDQKLSNLISYNESNGTYKSSQREASTTISVKNGETLAIGGLISHENKLTNIGIPILKDLPWLGHLFKSTVDQDERRELLIFITPTIVGSQEEAESITRAKKREAPMAVIENGLEFDL
jgi:general secretion pathway protein D